jgi:SAM-dependent methyltransferase
MVTQIVHKNAWYAEGVGCRLASAEHQQVSALLSELYGYYLCYLGEPGLASLVHDTIIKQSVHIHPHTNKSHIGLSINGAYESIPLLTDSVDAAVLLHTLEQSSQPHEVLREAHRILIPEGHLIITGFNPFSFWGLWLRYKQLRNKVPKQGNMLSESRIIDWLKLLNFQIVGGKMFYFKPPFLGQKFYKKFEFLETLGRNFWPFWGGAYTIIAVKKSIPLTPIKPKWRLKEIWDQGTVVNPSPSKFNK